MVVELKSFSQMEDQLDEIWVKWYGDNKFSKVFFGFMFLYNISRLIS